MKTSCSISVVVTIRNESFEDMLIHHLNLDEIHELILVDASLQKSHKVFEDAKIKYFHTPFLKHRAQVLNFGAKQASFEILLFLHSDCFPSEKALKKMKEEVFQNRLVGCFQKKYFPSSLWLNVQSWILNQMNSMGLPLLTGTNGFYISKEFFSQIGGFPEVEFLEDVLMFDKVKNKTKISIVKAPLWASSRRYGKSFPLLQSLKNAFIYLSFRLGISPQKLKKWYG